MVQVIDKKPRIMFILSRKKRELAKKLHYGQYFGQTKKIDGVEYQWLHSRWGKGSINPKKAYNGLTYAWVIFSRSKEPVFIRNYYLLSAIK
jgi:hypothetical protein